MGFLDVFRFNDSGDENKSELQKSIEQHFPDQTEQTYITYTCVAGLMARVAFADLKVELGEEKYMKEALLKWTELSEEDASSLTNLAIENVKKLVGLENHFYCSPLIENFSEGERYNLIKVLFQLAASDGDLANIEAEEIRSINTYLRLTHQHFISAKAEVTSAK